MTPALRLALSGKQDKPRTWGRRFARVGMKVRVIRCKAVGCLHAELIGKKGTVLRVVGDHALVELSPIWSEWIPQFHLKENK